MKKNEKWKQWNKKGQGIKWERGQKKKGKKLLLISSIGRNPHIALKGVNAIAISGLWFESLYMEGHFIWSLCANSLSGCALGKQHG